MAFSTDFILFIANLLLLPLIAFVVGYYRNREHAVKRERFTTRVGVWLISYYVVVVMAYLITYSVYVYYLYWPVLDVLAVLGFPSMLAGPVIAITMLAEGESIKRQDASGYCPMCKYDLRGDLDSGCPECGWNRDL